jgi:hypothetical protein
LFEDKVIRSIFGPREEEEVTGGMRKLYNESCSVVFLTW